MQFHVLSNSNLNFKISEYTKFYIMGNVFFLSFTSWKHRPRLLPRNTDSRLLPKNTDSVWLSENTDSLSLPRNTDSLSKIPSRPPHWFPNKKKSSNYSSFAQTTIIWGCFGVFCCLLLIVRQAKHFLYNPLGNFFFFLRDFIFKKTLFEKLQYLKQEQ